MGQRHPTQMPREATGLDDRTGRNFYHETRRRSAWAAWEQVQCNWVAKKRARPDQRDGPDLTSFLSKVILEAEELLRANGPD